MSRPTANQKRMWGRVFEVGCIACMIDGKFSFPEIHHAKDYGYRNHSNVYGLCPPHHRPLVANVVSRHGSPAEFEKLYGTDKELLEKCKELLGDKK